MQGYDNSESSVRKACVFCLVAIYAVIGEDLKPHLSQLSGSKVSPFLLQNVCFVFLLTPLYRVIYNIHILSLSSQLKLLNLYIKRAQSGSSGDQSSDVGGQGL